MTLWITRDEDVPSVPILWVHPELVSFYMRSFASTHHTNASVARSCCWVQVWRKETSRKAKQHGSLLLFTSTNKRRGFNTYWKSWTISYWNIFKRSEAVNTSSCARPTNSFFLFFIYPPIVLVHFPQLKAILLNTHSISLLCKYESKKSVLEGLHYWFIWPVPKYFELL